MRAFFFFHIHRQLAATWVKVDFSYDSKLLSPESNYSHFGCAITFSLYPLWSQKMKGSGDMRCFLCHPHGRCSDLAQMSLEGFLYFQVSRGLSFGSTTNLCVIWWLPYLKWVFFPITIIFPVCFVGTWSQAKASSSAPLPRLKAQCCGFC